jgi:hypothetical protein
MLNPGLLLHIDGIQGDCRIPHYLGWMDTFWFSFGGTGEYGQSRHGNLATMTMPVGRISTSLQLASLRNERFPNATLVALSPTYDSEKFRWNIVDVTITGFQFQGYSMDMPIHSLELKFGALEEKKPLSAADLLAPAKSCGNLSPRVPRVVSYRTKVSVKPTKTVAKTVAKAVVKKPKPRVKAR